MDFDTLWGVADRSRARARLSTKDVSFVRDVAPRQLECFPRLQLPRSIRHPAGFPVSGASVGTFLRGALLIAGQKALGKRFGGSEFYEDVEKDLAFGIMRSHFHHGYPKGVHCCVQCTLAVIPVLEAGAIRYFDCRELYTSVNREVLLLPFAFIASAGLVSSAVMLMSRDGHGVGLLVGALVASILPSAGMIFRSKKTDTFAEPARASVRRV
jgi:hypothetical protein